MCRMGWVPDISSHPQTDNPRPGLQAGSKCFMFYTESQCGRKVCIPIHLLLICTWKNYLPKKPSCSKLPWFLSVWKPKGVEFIYIRHCWLTSCSTEQWLLSFIRNQRRNISANQWSERHPNGYELDQPEGVLWIQSAGAWRITLGML